MIDISFLLKADSIYYHLAPRFHSVVAELQAMSLSPDELKIKELVNVLGEKKIGVVALFYMDLKVQGNLTTVQKQWPHIHILIHLQWQMQLPRWQKLDANTLLRS